VIGAITITSSPDARNEAAGSPDAHAPSTMSDVRAAVNKNDHSTGLGFLAFLQRNGGRDDATTALRLENLLILTRILLSYAVLLSPR